MSTLYKVMTKIKDKRGILSKDIAMSLGITPAYLCILEKGNRSIPDNFITNLTELLDLDLTEQKELAKAVIEIQKKTVKPENKLAKIKRELIEMIHRLFIKKSQDNQLDNNLIQQIIDLLEDLKKFGDDLFSIKHKACAL